MIRQRKNIAVFQAVLPEDWGRKAGYGILEKPVPPDLPGPVADETSLLDAWRLLAREEREVYELGLHVTLATEARLLFHRWRATGGVPDSSFTILSRADEMRVGSIYWLREMAERGGFGRLFDNPDRIEADLGHYPLRQRIEEPCFFLGSPPNWGHWLADSAVNLIHLAQFPALASRRLVLGEVMPFHKELLEALEIGPERWLSLAPEDIDFCAFAFDDLAVPLRPALTPSFEYLRRRLFDALKPDICSGPERIYLTRAGLAPRHRVHNEEEVSALLQSRGFAVVDLKGLSLHQTMEMLGNARIIVSPPGAGMGNYLLANPRAVIVNLFPRYFFHRNLETDHYTHWTMTYHFPFHDRMFFVMGDYDRVEQKDYVERHGLEGLDVPFHFSPRAIDLALLQAEKRWMQEGLR
ncbi:MAG: glycosyltransferase family 61 protein [Rhodospirillales bacterium]|nr:MAG: glycosyltransferase family 61 protein [Rhodospirillales bacterium]